MLAHAQKGKFTSVAEAERTGGRSAGAEVKEVMSRPCGVLQAFVKTLSFPINEMRSH